MLELMPIFVVSLVLAWFSHVFSNYNVITEDYEKKEWIFLSVMTVFMILFAGLRTNYNDTTTYTESYEFIFRSDMNPIESFKDTDWFSIGINPGFNFISTILKYYGFSTQAYLMFFAIISVPIYVWFIRKYSNNFLFSIFLFFIIGSYTFCLAAIKQSFAMALLLIATDREIDRKHEKFVFWVLIASTIHAYSWLYFIVPFLKFRPWTKKTYWSLLIFGFIGVFMSFALGGLLNITSVLGDEYSLEEMSGAGVNIFRVGVTFVPAVLSFIVKDRIHEKRYDEAINTIINLSILHAELMFIALFGTANYFARLANYFEMFAVVSIPFLINKVDKRYRTLLIVVAVILYSIYFYYGNVIAGWRPFDEGYNKIKLLDYFKNYSYFFRFE